MPAVAEPAVLAATSTSSSHSSPFPAGTIAGIIFAGLLGGVLLTALIIYLVKRYGRHRFTRIANPVHEDGEAAELSHTSSRRSKLFAHHMQKPSISSEPLISSDSWPPLPSTSSPEMPVRLDAISPGNGHSPHSSFDLGEIGQAVALGSLSRATLPAQHSSPASSRIDLGTPPYARQTSGNSAPPSPRSSTPTKTMFLYRSLKSRAQASDGTSLVHRPSFDLSHSRPATFDSEDVVADIERLLAEAERAALRDAEIVRKGERVEVAEEEDGVEEAESPDSIYSQGSMPIDHSGSFTDAPRETNTLPLSRRRPRTPAPAMELSPVAEIPDSTRVPRVSSPVPTVANSSLDAQGSHGTTSRATSLGGGALPLLTSAQFGKESTSGASGSISSASRCPSLVASKSSRSGLRSDAGTDWYHPPSGLAGLTTLRNPHSPVEEHPLVLVPAKRAHLREGTVSSIPEVEKRDVMQSGIARIDVALTS